MSIKCSSNALANRAHVRSYPSPLKWHEVLLLDRRHESIESVLTQMSSRHSIQFGPRHIQTDPLCHWCLQQSLLSYRLSRNPNHNASIDDDEWFNNGVAFRDKDRCILTILRKGNLCCRPALLPLQIWAVWHSINLHFSVLASLDFVSNAVDGSCIGSRAGMWSLFIEKSLPTQAWVTR